MTETHLHKTELPEYLLGRCMQGSVLRRMKYDLANEASPTTRWLLKYLRLVMSGIEIQTKLGPGTNRLKIVVAIIRRNVYKNSLVILVSLVYLVFNTFLYSILFKHTYLSYNYFSLFKSFTLNPDLDWPKTCPKTR